MPLQTSSAITPRDRARLTELIVHAMESPEVSLADASIAASAARCVTPTCRSRTLVPHGVTHWLTAEVRGNDRIFDVYLSLYAVGKDEPVVSLDTRCTICGQQELEEMLSDRTLGVRSELAVTSTIPANSIEPRSQTLQAVDHPQLGPVHPAMRPAGYVLLGTAAAALISGSVLVGIDGRDHASQCDNPDNVDEDGDCRFLNRTMGAGIGLIVGGVASSVASITLLTMDGQRRKAEVRARLGWRRVVLEGRF
jgi:hypothetical protein